MRKLSIHLALVLGLLCGVVAALAAAEQPKPLPGTSVHDFAGVIADDKKAEIQAKAKELKERFQTEIAVVTIDSLEGEESFDYSLRLARSWGIGSPDDQVRGLLILVAVKDRKTAFRTSRHIEGELPDGVTGDIGRQMNAYFKNGDFGGGLSLGMSKILERLSGVYEPQTKPQNRSGGGLIWLWVSLAGVAGIAVAVLLVRNARKRAREFDEQRARNEAVRRQYFAMEKKPGRQTGGRKKKVKEPKPKLWRADKKGLRQAKYKKTDSSASSSNSSSYDSSSSSYSSSSSSSSYDSSSSSYDSGSSSSYDSGSSYSGGSDFGGGGSDSSW